MWLIAHIEGANGDWKEDEILWGQAQEVLGKPRAYLEREIWKETWIWYRLRAHYQAYGGVKTRGSQESSLNNSQNTEVWRGKKRAKGNKALQTRVREGKEEIAQRGKD